YVTGRVSDDTPKLIGQDARQTPQEMTNIVGKSPILLTKGIGPKIDPSDVARQYQRAIDLYNGKGVAKDEKEAARLFRQVAEGEQHLMAMLWMGWIYEHGKGVEQNHQQAVSW